MNASIQKIDEAPNAGAGIEPAHSSFKATDFYQQKLTGIGSGKATVPQLMGKTESLPIQRM